jgi:flagellar basal body-associated protein FliL
MSQAMSRTLMPVVAVLVVAAGAAGYKLAGSEAEPAPKHKIEGQVYVLEKPFIVSLAKRRYALLSVALVLDPEAGAPGDGGGHAPATKPPAGYGALSQEGLVRSAVSDTLTDRDAAELLSPAARRTLAGKIARTIRDRADVEVRDVLFTDVAVQV